MPRFARVHVTGGLFHVISRFHDDRSYLDLPGARPKYFEFLDGAARRHDSRLIAFCLMSNHVHLVLQLGADRLGVFTKAVHSPFASWVNSMTGGRGSVFADRPKSLLVHAETYGMELLRYVHNNPVRAGLVASAADSDWSSMRMYLGLEEAPKWLSVEAVLGPDIADRDTVRRELLEYTDAGRTEKRRQEFSGAVSRTLAKRIRRLLGGDVELSYPVLGPDAFVLDSLREQARRAVPNGPAARVEIGVGDLVVRVFSECGIDAGLAQSRTKRPQVSRARALVAWLWVEKLGRPVVEVADSVGVRPNAVSAMLTRLRQKGLSVDETEIVQRVFDSCVDNAATPDPAGTTGNHRRSGDELAPRIFVLRRER